MTSFEECTTLTLIIHHHTHQLVSSLKQIFFITVTYFPCERPQWFIKHHLIQWAPFRFLRKKPAPLRGDSDFETTAEQISGTEFPSRTSFTKGPQRISVFCIPADATCLPGCLGVALSRHPSIVSPLHWYQLTLSWIHNSWWLDVPTVCGHPANQPLNLGLSHNTEEKKVGEKSSFLAWVC